MNIVDIILSVFLLLLFYRGFRRGFIGSIVYLLGLWGTIFVMRQYSYRVAHLLSAHIRLDATAASVLGHVITIVLCLVVIRLVIKLINSILDAIHLNLINRIFGGVFASFNGVLLLAVILLIIGLFTGVNKLDMESKANNAGVIAQVQGSVNEIVESAGEDNALLKKTLSELNPTGAATGLKRILVDDEDVKKSKEFSRKVSKFTQDSVILSWAQKFTDLIIRKSSVVY